jgi:hypothetical protein
MNMSGKTTLPYANYFAGTNPQGQPMWEVRKITHPNGASETIGMCTVTNKNLPVHTQALVRRANSVSWENLGEFGTLEEGAAAIHEYV